MKMSMPKTFNQKSFFSGAGNSNSRINLVAAAAAIVVLIALVSFIAWKNVGPAATSGNNAVPTAQDNANNAVLTQLANKSQGNFNQLTSEEQNEANQLTHDHGALAMSVMYKGKK
jgi:F0F1-type ATP synthase membrane subunit b/b'